MTKVTVVYTPYKRYVIQLGYPVSEVFGDEPISFEWEDKEFHDNFDKACKYADAYAIDHKYVHVWDRGEENASPKTETLTRT